MSRHFYPALFAPLFVLVAGEAEAASTGSLRGHVDDDMGLSVPGATIVLTGKSIAGQLLVTTDDNGDFRFVSVPVGTHTLQITRSGFTPVRMQVTVRLDETAFAPIVLKVSGTAEIVIEQELPVLDTTESSVSTNLTQESLQNLPAPRNFGMATRMLPGVYGRVDTQDGGPGGGNPSVRGEGQYGNNYFIDGVSNRDTATKTFGQDVNFDVIEEIQVYTDGAPAEFSEATGMVVNVVTTSGGDEHFGSASYFFGTNASFAPTYELLGTEQNKEVYGAHELSLVAAGPIVKEKLWYVLSLEGTYSTGKGEGWLAEPGTGGGFVEADSGLGEVASLPYESPGIGGFAKFTWFATPDLSFSYQFKGGWQNTPEILTPTILYSPESQQDQTDTDWAHQATVVWRPDVKTEIELKGVVSRSNLDVVPSSGDEDTPQIVNIDESLYTNNADSFDYNIRGRSGVDLEVTRLADGSTGSHKFKGGVSYYLTTDSRELVFTGPGEGATYYASADAGYPCVEADFSDCYGYRAYTDAGALAHKGYVLGTFIQDDWSPSEDVTMNIGMRLDHEELYANANNRVYENWLPAPRAGLAWDLTGDNRTKLSINAGRYYDIAGNSFADWGDTRSAATYYEYRNSPDGYTLDYVQDPAVNALIYDPELRPYHLDKIVVGIEREILPLFAVGIRGILSQTVDLPEDVDTDLDYWYITNPSSKRRDYRAVELTAEKKLKDGWQLLASYTLSESIGSMPGQFELSPGGQSGSNGNDVGVYLDDVNDMSARESFFDTGAGWLLQGLAGMGTESDDAGYYGYLPYHSFHQAKVNGSYSFDWGTTVGLVYEFDSGHAWQKRGWVELYGDYFAFPEGRGSRFMPAVHYVDLHLEQAIALPGEKEVAVALDVFNLFDFQQVVSYGENDDNNFGLALYRQSPRSIRAMVKFTY